MRIVIFFSSALFILGLVFCQFNPSFAEDNSTSNDNLSVPAACKPHLFEINKSDNKNVLYYDAIIRNGEFDTANPVDIYWIMNAEKGQREGLTLLESPQFGIITKEVKKGKEYIINVKNDELSEKDIRVFFGENNCPEATATLSGKDARLDNIYINLTRGIMLPTVHWLELTGYALTDGEKVTERITPK
ncbi:MAG: DUF4833 domain-containing protein [Deferribacteraceae bacterium]|jgi:hypothetical protein|nr:DUF4833 domain-containing protein [Deferribacteraceae bacterium]